MRILFLSPRQCHPPTTGARLREFHLARQLSRAAEITLLGFGSMSPDQARAQLPFATWVEMVPPPPRYTARKLAQGLFSRQPLTVINYGSAAMEEALSRLLRQTDFDVIQVEGTPMAGYAPLCRKLAPRALVVYDWHNIESELLDRFAAQTPSWPKSLYARITARRLRVVEAGLLSAGDGHLVCSQRENVQLLTIAPRARVATIANGVDVASFETLSMSDRPDPARNRLLFVGSMDYHANIDAATQFARTIWPSIRQRWPHLRFTLVGSNPTPAVRELAREEGIEVTGTVPDVRPYYRDAFATVVPLLTGGGTRLKILEALAAAVPVISTSLGAEGLDVRPGHELLIAGSVQEWMAALAELSGHPRRWNEIALAGRRRAETSYDWTVIAADLHALYRDWLSAPRTFAEIHS
jgi:sugar transferase (PEP-CTERM/EpsH1 system associated)